MAFSLPKELGVVTIARRQGDLPPRVIPGAMRVAVGSFRWAAGAEASPEP